MNFKSQRREDLDINLTPLIDVVFLLLIFFMVSTTFNRESQIAIELPEASGPKLETKQFMLEVSVDSQGHYYVNQQRLKDDKVATLMQAIRLKVKGKEDIQLIISSDKNTPYQAVVTAMDAVKQLGYTQFSLTTKQREE
jgi:biopolymer transport protein ExbD